MTLLQKAMCADCASSHSTPLKLYRPETLKPLIALKATPATTLNHSSFYHVPWAE